MALDLVGFGVLLPILPLYAERFGASPTTIGFLAASFSVAQLALAPVWGRISDRIGRKPVILISLFGTAAGSFITGAAGTLWLLFLGRVVDGASGASVSVAQAAVTDVAEPSQRPRLLGLLGAAFGVGFVAGPAIGALAALGGPHVPFYLAGALAFVNGVVAIKRLPETHPPGPRREVRSERAPAPPGTRAALARLALVAFVSLCAFSGFEATFALFGERRFDLGLSSTSGVFVAVGLVLVVVQGGAIHPAVERFGALGTLRIGLLCDAAGLLLLAMATTWPVLIVALGVLVVGQGLITPTLSSVVAGRVRAERRGSALGVQQSAGGLARIVGPALGGALFQHVSVRSPYLVGAALMGVAVVLVLTEREPHDARPPAVPDSVLGAPDRV